MPCGVSTRLRGARPDVGWDEPRGHQGRKTGSFVVNQNNSAPIARAVRPDAAPTAAPVIPAADEIFVLSPFIVDASKDTGYRAENTLAGSRLNSSLRDTASS